MKLFLNKFKSFSPFKKALSIALSALILAQANFKVEIFMEKTHKIILSVLAVALVGIIISCVIVSQSDGKKQIPPEFSAPAFDRNAVIVRVDDIPQSAEYKSLTIKEGFKISMASVVSINDKTAKVYFTSDADNNAWLKIEVLSADGKTSYGESGLLKQGETLEKLTLNSTPKGNELIIKILSYEPDTYYSLGTATVKVNIAK